MRLKYIPIVLLLAMFGGLGSAAERDTSLTIYVSNTGDDRWSGSMPASNPGRTDGPVRTLDRAKRVERDIRLGNPVSNVQVAIRGGVYILERTLHLDKGDAGTAQHPAVWSPFNGEVVRLMGGKSLHGFHPVTESHILTRIRAEYRDKILVADLRGQGITDYGVLPNRMNLFFAGRRMTVARYPNKGWLTIADVPQSGDSLLNEGDKKVIKDGHPAGRHYGRFTYDGDRPKGWADRDDIWMHGYWAWDWRDDYQKVQQFDRLHREITLSPPYHYYGFSRGQRYRFLNILEELDTPGEWCLDEDAGVVYFWPPSTIGGANTVTVSMLKEPMVLIDNSSHILFENITFECSRGSAVRIIGGGQNTIAGCTVRNIDNDTSIVIDGGENNGVVSCDIEDVGATGIKISGGDRKTLTPAGNYATNNHIHNYGRIVQGFSGAIWMDGVGNILSHNRIHDAPFSGIQFYGNDHSIEFNELFDLAHESGDVGGVNTGGDYADQGTRIRYNFFHHTHGIGEGGFRAVYLDLPGSNTEIVGNVFYRVDIGVFFNSGRDNLIKNNMFVECHPSVSIYIWPHKQYFHRGGPWKIVEKLENIGYTRPPFSVRYPKLPRYLDSADLGMPYGNVVVNNVSYGGTWLDLSEALDFSQVRVERNVIADSTLLVATKAWTPDYDPYHIGYTAVYQADNPYMNELLAKYGNRVVVGDPGFVDAQRGDFRLKAGSTAFGIGFTSIPVEKFGLYIDKYRKHLDMSPQYPR